MSKYLVLTSDIINREKEVLDGTKSEIRKSQFKRKKELWNKCLNKLESSPIIQFTGAQYNF